MQGRRSPAIPKKRSLHYSNHPEKPTLPNASALVCFSEKTNSEENILSQSKPPRPPSFVNALQCLHELWALGASLHVPTAPRAPAALLVLLLVHLRSLQEGGRRLISPLSLSKGRLGACPCPLCQAIGMVCVVEAERQNTGGSFTVECQKRESREAVGSPSAERFPSSWTRV